MKISRFQKYLNRFKKEEEDEPVKKAHLGETLVTDLGDVIVKRLNQILPFFIASHSGKNSVRTMTSSTSFWDEEDKYLVLTVFLRFDKDIVWKDEIKKDQENGS